MKGPGYRVGCAGWSIASAADPDRSIFSGPGTHLERYARVFSCVEINSSFYRPHQPATYARWADSVPETFRFAVKAPKAITHEARLRNADALLARFLGECRMLGPKLGALLVQLPPKLAWDAPAAGAFFSLLRERLTELGSPIIACEARHASWFTAEADALLHAHGVARVRADPLAVPTAPRVDGPAADNGAADGGGPVYLRLHGSPVIYRSAYPADFLERVARALRAHAAAGRPAWCVFDNTADFAAVPDALALRRLLGLALPQAPRRAPAAAGRGVQLAFEAMGAGPLGS